MKFTSEIDIAYHIPGIHDNGPRDHELWRRTLTAYYLLMTSTPDHAVSIPAVKTHQLDRSFIHTASKVWNSLPEQTMLLEQFLIYGAQVF